LTKNHGCAAATVSGIPTPMKMTSNDPASLAARRITARGK
jgi:hypothetical protein